MRRNRSKASGRGCLCRWQLSQRDREFSYGVVILRDGKELCFQEKLNDPSLAAMHNVAGEIKGAECAMRYAVAEGLSEITIVHDYVGSQNGVWANGKLAKKGHRLIKHFMIVSSPRYM